MSIPTFPDSDSFRRSDDDSRHRREWHIGLTGNGVMHIAISIPNGAFDLIREERALVFAIVDAIREHEAFCRTHSRGASEVNPSAK